MTKTICDICGKEMGNNKVGAIHELNFCISSYGKMWDVCNKCREELNEWINQHKMKSESKSDSGNLDAQIKL